MLKHLKKLLAGLLLSAGLAGTANAGVPVLDTANLLSAIQQVLAWVEQLQSMKNQYDQTVNQLNALTGIRNVGDLLNSELLNQYIPKDYASSLQDLRQGVGDLSTLSNQLTSVVQSNQIVSCTDATTTQAARDKCSRNWQSMALNKTVGDLGYKQASKNIDQLQTFITSIKTSADPKSLQDLSARIEVENVRMANEQVKLNTIQMMAKADEDMRRQAATDAIDSTLNTGGNVQIQF